MERGTEARGCGALRHFCYAENFLSQIYTLFKSFFLSQIRQLEKRTNAKYAQPYLRFRLGSQPSPFSWARGEGEIFSHPVPPDSLSVTGTRTLSRPPASHLPCYGAARHLITSRSTHARTHAPPFIP